MIRLPFRQKRALGQHFLVDENIVRVAGRLAELSRDDVVLEVGPGLGVLTRLLADEASFVHTVEIDWSLEPHLRQLFATRKNVDVVFNDALELPLADLRPEPTKFVANLPYNVATPLVAEGLDGLPTVQLWCVMVQREVADRFFAKPGARRATGPCPCSSSSRPSARASILFREPSSGPRPTWTRRSWPSGGGARGGPSSRGSSGSCGRRSRIAARRLPTRSRSPGYRSATTPRLRSHEIGHPPGARAETLVPDEFIRLAELVA